MRAGLIAVCMIASQLTAAQLSLLRRDLSIRAHSEYGFAGLPRQLAAGDFNNDGSPDLVVVTAAGFSVYLNRSNGSFGETTQTIREMPGPVVAADFNGDGSLDLLSAGLWRPDGELQLGKGDGTFLPAIGLAGFGWPAVTADFNSDGRADVACVNRMDSSFSVRLGNGDATFQPPKQVVHIFFPTVLVAADFDGDRVPDIAGRGGLLFGGEGIWVLASSGDGTFKTPIDALNGTLGEDSRDVLLAADFDGDGLADIATEIAVIRSGGATGVTFPAVVFHSPQNYIKDFENRPSGCLAAADLDRDGSLDLVAGSICGLGNHIGPGAVLSLFGGKGDGRMDPPVLFATGWGPSDLVVADFDADGWPDIASLNRTASTISVLLTREGVEQTLASAVNAVNGTAILAPGSLASLFARLPGVAAQQASSPSLPEQLGGVSLEVRDAAGVTRKAPLLYVSDTQINFMVPDDTGIGDASLIIVQGTTARVVKTVQVENVSPAVLLANSIDMTPLAFDIRAGPGGEQTNTPVFTCNGFDNCHPVPVRPSRSGSLLVFVVSGFRNATPADVKCSIRGLPLEVERVHSGAVPGTQEVTVRVPPEESDFWDLPGGDVHLSARGIAANITQITFDVRRTL